MLKIIQSLLRQLQQELKIVVEKEERSLFLYIMELLLDLVTVNAKQAKTGTGDITQKLKDRFAMQP